MFTKIRHSILNYPLAALFAILVITIFFYYQAFLSENPIRVDFSLEQMYPDVDPDRELYKIFCETFSREDDIGFFTYTGDDVFSREAIENIAFIAGIYILISLGLLIIIKKTLEPVQLRK